LFFPSVSSDPRTPRTQKLNKNELQHLVLGHYRRMGILNETRQNTISRFTKYINDHKPRSLSHRRPTKTQGYDLTNKVKGREP